MLTGKEDDAPGPIDMPRGNAREVLAVFLRLGLTSFGGPIAHLGYFRDEYVAHFEHGGCPFDPAASTLFPSPGMQGAGGRSR